MLHKIRQNSAPLEFGAAVSLLLAALFIERVASSRSYNRAERYFTRVRRALRARRRTRSLAVAASDRPSGPPGVETTPPLTASSQFSRLSRHLTAATKQLLRAGDFHRKAVTQLDCLEIGLEDLRTELANVMPQLAPVMTNYGSKRTQDAFDEVTAEKARAMAA